MTRYIIIFIATITERVEITVIMTTVIEIVDVIMIIITYGKLILRGIYTILSNSF